MTAITSSELPAVSRRVLHFQLLTIAWMTIEAVISLGATWSSHSPALFAFDGDSMIELLSAAVVFWRFRFELSELRAARMLLATRVSSAGHCGQRVRDFSCVVEGRSTSQSIFCNKSKFPSTAILAAA